MKIFIKFILFFFITSLIYSQNNITNTLGAGGTFTIKDGSTTFFTIDQSDGRITLPITTGPSIGVIFKGYNRFIHDFAPTGSVGGNIFIGRSSGNFTMTFTSGNEASRNTAIGRSALNRLTTGWDNTAIGYESMFYNTSGNRNTALGLSSLYSNTTGVQNTALGYSSLGENTTGGQNSAVGNYSLATNTTGQYNTAVGHFSLLSNISGSENTAVGHHSLQISTGNYNTALGYNAGSTVTTGANLTLLGIDANPSSPTVQNQITLGNSFVTSLRCNVQSISSLSDQRDKKNIKDLDLGIDFLMKIKPRLYNWDKREWYADNKSDGSKMKEEPTAGFIAQELDEVQTTENAEWLNLVLKDNPEKLEATPGNLLPIIVKAIQELNNEKDNEIAELYKRIRGLENELIKIKSNNNVVQISNSN
jgi:hypothetical protein